MSQEKIPNLTALREAEEADRDAHLDLVEDIVDQADLTTMLEWVDELDQRKAERQELGMQATKSALDAVIHDDKVAHEGEDHRTTASSEDTEQ